MVRFLAQNFEVVSLDEFIVENENPRAVQKNGLVVLSFDDGLRHHAELIYPVLKNLNVPATFYVCPELIDRARSIWTWEVRARLERLSDGPRQRFFDLAGVSGQTQAIVNWMKTIPVAHREEIEKEIRDCTQDFEFTQDERDCFELMSWDQMQKLDPALITIGSHTSTHIDLPQADTGRIERELSSSKGILESRLKRKVEHFSYPNGNFNDAMLDVVRRYYRSAVTTKQDVVKQGDDLFLLPRINADLNLSRFLWELAVNADRKYKS